MAHISLEHISKTFGATPVLHDVSLHLKDGEFLAILGPSGCGKSTLLRILAGLEGCDAGTIRIAGEDVTEQPAKARNLAMVFQSYALYPHMSVRQNIALPLELRRLSLLERLPLLGRLVLGSAARRAAIDAEVTQVAAALELGALLQRRPSQLSGGQRQRVALARAMVRQPAAFLMDEPLSNLDARLRGEAREEIVALQRRLGATMLYVTHDQEEAMAMADRVAVMQAGRLLQVAPPQQLYNEPCSIEVARFVGSPPMNIFTARVGHDGRIEVAGVPLPYRSRHQGLLRLGVRPETLIVGAHGLPARLVRTEWLGAEAILHTTLLHGPERALVRVRPEEATGLEPRALLHLMPRCVHLFTPEGMRLSIEAMHNEAVHG
jgi:multiple sugar transport system ATP-binding protein